MRTPDEDGSGTDVSTTVGDGFGPVTGDDLEDGFGDDDFSDDNSFDDGFGDGSDADDGTGTGDDGDTPFGDGLSDAEAENVLVEILEDVFGADAPDVLEEVDVAADPTPVVDDPFEPAEIPAESDFDFTGDGHVDVHDLHEAAHPFDFDISE